MKHLVPIPFIKMELPAGPLSIKAFIYSAPNHSNRSNLSKCMSRNGLLHGLHFGLLERYTLTELKGSSFIDFISSDTVIYRSSTTSPRHPLHTTQTPPIENIGRYRSYSSRARMRHHISTKETELAHKRLKLKTQALSLHPMSKSYKYSNRVDRKYAVYISASAFAMQ